jgi:hydrogenase maturation protease
MRLSATDRPVLVIGYGNSLRRDDGAGLVLAQAMVQKLQEQDCPATLITAHQLSPELAEDIAQSGADTVIFVDAAVTSASNSTRIDATPVSFDCGSPSVGHHLTPATLMLYANRLYGYMGEALILTVPGYDFAHGEGLSAATLDLINDFLKHWPGPLPQRPAGPHADTPHN